MTSTQAQQTLRSLHDHAKEASIFASVALTGERLECEAKDSAAKAQYRIEAASDGWRLSLGTADRWLSESIESQLVESRDSMEDLLREELVDLDCLEAPPKIRHFRDESKRYVFECTVPFGADLADDLQRAQLFLFAFESMFRQLGDMSGAGSEE